MEFSLAIRREDKNQWERRTPIVPDDVKKLKDKYQINTILQPSKIRAFKEDEYKKAGAEINEDLSSANVIFAVKEIPKELFEKGKTYAFFSHVIKGQKYNMPMLKKMMELKCNLIDYEKIVDSNNKRLVFFGRYAGLAGMIDSLWAFGKILQKKGYNSILNQLKQTIEYKDLDEVKKSYENISKIIKKDGLPSDICPVVVGFAGYGNVSKGAQEILDLLPVKEISPDDISDIKNNHSKNMIYKVVFKEENMVKPRSSENKFELNDYYNNPERYISKFEEFIPNLSILMNCIYWDNRYPRLITKKFIHENFDEKFKLSVIGDISVDVNGAVEITEKITNPGKPVFTYNPKTKSISDEIKPDGISVMAVDNLPCELPKESSTEFSKSLFDFISSMVKADYNADFEEFNLPKEVKNAVILYHGKLTPSYQYINNYL